MCARFKILLHRLRNFLCSEPTQPLEIKNIEADNIVESFVQNTIVQICTGVAAARDELSIRENNKGWVNVIKEEDKEKNDFPTQTIEFDISLSTSLAKKIDGSVEIKTMLHIGNEHSHNNENLSRVKFSVPITLPVTVLSKSSDK